MRIYHKLAIFGLASAIAVAALSLVPAKAANTTFLTDKNGNQVFPMSPPTRSPAAPGAIDNMSIGQTTPAAGRFTQMQPGGPVPTIASGACGTTTNGAVVAGSTSMSGQITIGAAATTTCTVTFGAVLPQAPKSCTFFPMNATAATAATNVFGSAPTTGGFVLNGTNLASSNYAYQCF